MQVHKFFNAINFVRLVVNVVKKQEAPLEKKLAERLDRNPAKKSLETMAPNLEQRLAPRLAGNSG